MTEKPHNNLALFKFLPRFKSIEIEQEFRTSLLPEDKLFVRIIIIGAIFISLASIIPDSLSGADYSSLQGLYLASFAFIFFNLMLTGLLICTTKYQQFDIITKFWWLGVITTVSVGNTFYPSTLFAHTVFDIMIPVAIYLLIPIGLISQFLLALIFTAANLFILFFLKTGLTQTDAAFILVAYSTAHLLGLVSCWQIHLNRRKRFVVQKTEQILKKNLQQSLDEIKILQGIIPICAYCKQVRDDEGFWHQVETYIRKYSGAEFTHGICPECLQENFPREYKIIQEKNSERND